jgi:signal transduction histidine kinase/ligand-binding sensor domain-containing protein
MLRFATKFCLRSMAANAAVLIASVFALSHPSCARSETLGSYHHTSFREQDGAPGGVEGFAQTSDGFLWVAGSKGLTRFDGNAFTAFQVLPGENFPEARLDVIYPAEGGGLWIANSTAGATLLKDGHLSTFGPDQGYLGAHGHFLTDKNGHVWSCTTVACMKFTNGSWQVVYRNGPGHPITHASFDSDGNLWAIIDQHILVLPAGGSHFLEVSGGPEGARHVFAGVSDHLFVATKDELHFYRRNELKLTEVAKPISVPVFRALESRTGSIWLGSLLRGLYYISKEDLQAAEASHSSPNLQHLTQFDGLTNNFVFDLLEDAEGDIWVATSTGLDRFRRSAFTQIDLPPGIHSISASVDHQGELWVGSETHPLLFGHLSGDLKETELPRLTLAFYVDPRDENVWAGNIKGVWRLAPGTPRLEIPLTSKEVGTSTTLPCMLRDSQGSFYVCVPYNGTGNGLLVSDGHGWKEVFDHPVFPMTLAIDVDGNIWVGSKDRNRLYKLSNGSKTLFNEQQGLAVGVIRAIYPEGDALWVGGDAGIQFFDGRRFVTISSDSQEIKQPVTGLVEDRHGDLWAQTLDGVLRIRSDDIRKFRNGSRKQVHLDLFDEEDGIPGKTDLDWTLPSLRKSSDGRIWALTETGLAWIDPDDIPTQDSRPSVYVDGIDASNQSYPATGSDIHLPATEKTLRIRYSSPSLSRPDKITFRYRLVGMSDTWQDVGNRREATFTNVPPGHFRFEVIATNANGLSSLFAATARFERLPAFYETFWFRALMVLPIVLLLWLAHDLRARSLARRLKIRSDEREAVARNIHDTLLQRLHAVMISLQGLSTDESLPPTSRVTIGKVYEETRDAISEGREQIATLRRDRDLGLALYDQLLSEGRRLQARAQAYFALEVRGSPRPLKNGPDIELRDIAIEAMRNAFTHSGASKVLVTFNYEDRAFWLVVSDDGVGFSANEADRARQNGHFGLVGMRERVASLRGSINIESSQEEGTEVHVRIPAKTVYVCERKIRKGSDQMNEQEHLSG